MSGLSVFNHVAMGFLCVGWVCCLLVELLQKRLPAQKLPSVLGAFALGFSPWLAVFGWDWIRIGGLAPTVKQAFFGPFSGLMFASPLTRNLAGYWRILAVEFPNGYFLACFPGLILFWRRFGFRGPVLGLTVAFLLNAIFFINYETWNRFCHLLPSLVLLCFFGASFLREIWERMRHRSLLLRRAALAAAFSFGAGFPIYVFSMLTTWGSDPNSVWYPQYANQSSPCFRTNELIANPNKRGFNDYQEYADALFRILPQNAIYVDDDGRGYYTIEAYEQKILGLRPDLALVIINSFGIDNAGWGESPGGLASLIARAYYTDRPLFMISQEWPFARALRELPGGERFAWAPFPVEDRCSIFRLKTQRENPEPSRYRPDLEKLLAKPLVFSKRTPVVNVTGANVNLVKSAGVVMQDMRGYGNAWMNDDQLFIRGEGPGSWVEFLIDSPVERRVSLRFNFTTSYDYGIVAPYLNEVQLAPPVDLYSPKVWVKPVTSTPVLLRAGTNHLLLKISGKNMRSSGYIVGVDSIEAVDIR